MEALANPRNNSGAAIQPNTFRPVSASGERLAVSLPFKDNWVADDLSLTHERGKHKNGWLLRKASDLSPEIWDFKRDNSRRLIGGDGG